MDVPQILFDEESIFILLQFLRHINDLFIVYQQLADFTVDLIDPSDFFLRLRVQDFIFDPVKLVLIAFHDRQVVFHYLFQKII